MPKQVSRLRDMEIDEVSVVDKGAASDALIAIAKRANQEVDMPEYQFEDGSPVDVEDLEAGDIVFDEEGNAYEWVLPEVEVEDEEQVLEPVGKSAFGSFSDEIREELSKAFSSTATDNSGQKELFAKAAAEIDSLRKQVAESNLIAKRERETRMLTELTEVAKSYNIPGNPVELAGVLLRMGDAMSYEDCSVIHKALTAAGATIFDEIGYIGGGDNTDILSQVSKAAEDAEVDISKVFDENPDAYDAYLAEKK